MDAAEAVAVALIVGGGLYVLHSRASAVPAAKAPAPADPTEAMLGSALGAAGLGPWGNSAAYVITHPTADANAVRGAFGAPSAILGRITGTDKTPSISAGLQGWIKPK
jgi:hypothetical protein